MAIFPHHMPLATRVEEACQVLEKLQRSWQKLCPEGRTLMQEGYQAALKLLAAV